MSILNSPLKECGATSGGTWYAAHTRHQHEKTVAQMLANKGFEVFLPLYTEVRQWRDRQKRLELPLFSCYVFLRGNVDRRLAILTTPGVHGLVTSAGKLAAIPEEEIEAVRSVINNRIKVEPHPFLKCGDLVRVKSGALRGLEGFLVRKKGETRLVISVNLLERSVAAEVDASMVEKVTAAVRKEATDIVSAGPGNRYRDGIFSAGIMPDTLQMVSAQVPIAPR
ncbi:MAG TPA: UpxY family transcription antiterminator [Terriglobia bacterium]|jgi:transcription antitermination factor NusG|nr:UpxY family transcription antiterminator [Terriglobia bacterium]